MSFQGGNCFREIIEMVVFVNIHLHNDLMLHIMSSLKGQDYVIVSSVFLIYNEMYI